MPGTTNKRRTPGKKMRVLSITLAGLLLLFALRGTLPMPE